MYFSNGNYEAFARPKKPEGVEKKTAYFVGAGIASLAGAAFLVRDGQMDGNKIHILEELPLPGGSCDAIYETSKGFIIRGGREMENHFECLWDLFRSIPSLEIEGASVLDEFYWLNKEDPNYSLMRAIENRGQDAHTDGKFALSDDAAMEIAQLFLTKNEDLNDIKINDVFSDDFFSSNFWLYWRTMFAFEEWHSALEMKLYLQRFIHHIQGLPDFKALKFTKYNQYESLILPLTRYLEDYGVDFQYNVIVENVKFDITGDKKVARELLLKRDGKEETIHLTEDDLVFITNGSMTENSNYGDNDKPAEMDSSIRGCWKLWKNIAQQDPAFGNPDVFCSNTELSNWESATVTCLDNQIPEYIRKISKRDPYSGRVVTGGIVTIKDSNWLMSYTVNRQPHFKEQPKDQIVVWIYSLFTDRPGNYIKKAMRDCTGREIVQEWLYHLGVPEEQIEELSKTTNAIPVMMPYITSQFMPRAMGDRPEVVPKGCINAAFIGQFAETERGTVFTTEYSVRTAMIAVYTLLNIDRGVPEVFASQYDIRVLLDSTIKLLDGRKPKIPLSFIAKKKVEKFIGDTTIEEMLEKYGWI
ncbi:oleate hydratase [Anaerosalibacter massiliensis]|uniref:Oleate hydratase n=1 Tax=Anaerosalibacter massiliensis TaxID=1347392 RepID=A0A9X2MNI7_9FIRM|nr:oleate hydratase [Anaerosalibacter massiliensis]MCR2044271.1 oleate hydratase [Anaerosalibacter massiliensis]